MKLENAPLRRMKVDAPDFRVQQRADSNQPVLVGYAAKFDVVADIGLFTESIAPGAFAESIARPDDVRALFNHDPNLVLGRNVAGTLELAEDAIGLVATIYPPDTSFGADIVKSIERGDITQMSFGFLVEEEESQYPETGKPHFVLKKVRLFDVSPVTYPAYEATEIDLKRATRHRIAEISRRAEAELGKRTRELKLLTLALT